MVKDRAARRNFDGVDVGCIDAGGLGGLQHVCKRIIGGVEFGDGW